MSVVMINYITVTLMYTTGYCSIADKDLNVLHVLYVLCTMYFKKIFQKSWLLKATKSEKNEGNQS